MLVSVANNIRVLCEYAPKNATTFVPSRLYRTYPEMRPDTSLFTGGKRGDISRQLPKMSYTPECIPPNVELPYKHPRASLDMRGPERIHNQLIYRHSGLIALRGGSLTGNHMDVIRNRVNKYMNLDRFFAVWRVDPPWKPVSKKSQNKRQGGGKTKVHHYETPVKAGRVIFEIAGIGDHGEVRHIIENVANKMPFFCMPISQQDMNDLKEESERIARENYNPFDYRDLLRRNMGDSRRFVDQWEARWGGRYF